MSSLPSTALGAGLTEAIQTKLSDAECPLKLEEVVKGLPKPSKTKPAAFKTEIQQLLNDDIRLGKVFSYPSGKNGVHRYWVKDEVQLLREKAIESAATPTAIAALKTKLGKEVKGADPAFIEGVVRDLISEDRLFEYPAKTAKGGPLFGATPPPPPVPTLEQPAHKKTVDKLVADCRKLLDKAGVSADELFQILRLRLIPADDLNSAPAVAQAKESEPTTIAKPADHLPQEPSANADLQELIMKAVEMAPILSLAELRAEMPREYQGHQFDEAVLQLADDYRVQVNQDADPLRFSDAERANYVRDGAIVFTTIMKRS